MQGEDSFDALVVYDTADGEGFVGASAAAGDNGAGEDLCAYFVAFLDAAAMSYPGFVITGDVVRLLEHCPVCDRVGPVLEPEVRRGAGEDLRGCAEEVRRMVAIDVGG